SDLELGRRRESGGVEIFRDASAVELVGIGDAIRTLDGESEARIVVRGLGHGHGGAYLNPGEASGLPAGNFPDARNIVNPAEGKDARDVAARNIFFEMAVVRIGGAGRV